MSNKIVYVDKVFISTCTYALLLSHFDYGQYLQQLFDMRLQQFAALHPHAGIQTC